MTAAHLDECSALNDLNCISTIGAEFANRPHPWFLHKPAGGELRLTPADCNGFTAYDENSPLYMKDDSQLHRKRSRPQKYGQTGTTYGHWHQSPGSKYR
ncbi:hypothetical protein TNCV_104041 [Trichonephila clavipes]|nr:hypothetical protein TNCV_104041 [Trichonephila clavipes]